MNGFFINTPIAQRSANYCLWINEWILKEEKEKIVFLEFKIIYFCVFVWNKTARIRVTERQLNTQTHSHVEKEYS